MVNAVRGKLREERTTAQAITDASDDLNTEIIDLINDAGSEILEGNDWPFDVRHDGELFYPASQSGTNAQFGPQVGTAIYSNTTSILILTSGDTDSGEVFEDFDLASFRCSGNRARVRIIGPDTNFGNTSWIVTNVENASGIGLTMTTSANLYFPTPATNGAWTTYANEVVLPDTVKEVLSVRHEEKDIALKFVDREIQFDHVVPRPSNRFGSVPEVVLVGGTITSTARGSLVAWSTISAEAAVTGTCAAVWPIPDTDTHIQYSYRVQHSDLSAATDAWTGVPSNVIGMIQDLAVQKAYDSGIQNDPVMGARIERNVEKRRQRARNSLMSQPNRRRVPAGFGTRRSGGERRRWATQEVSAP